MAKLLSVIGGLVAMALLGTGSGAVSFQSASAAQARVDAVRVPGQPSVATSRSTLRARLSLWRLPFWRSAGYLQSGGGASS
jgi:hypothetical protein